MNRKELEDAINELEHKQQNYQTIEKLAHLYSVYNELYNNIPNDTEYSRQAEKQPTIVFNGDDEFTLLINKIGIEKAFPVIVELIEVVQVTNPKLYNGFIRKMYDL